MTVGSAPLMAHLAEVRRGLRITGVAMAHHLGVRPRAVSLWENGHVSPRLPHLLGYAVRVKRRLVVHDGSRILAEGQDILAVLPQVRRSTGLLQRDVAEAMRVGRPAVAMFETRRSATLVSVEAYVTALGLRLGVAPARDVQAAAS